mmetsp:Transcript_94642/g.289518  ORF Transcript_94642/g.289518 Transcript_94642/m.289518 type:complete len:215 (+) Transcript_94642:5609-6253(+)
MATWRTGVSNAVGNRYIFGRIGYKETLRASGSFHGTKLCALSANRKNTWSAVLPRTPKQLKRAKPETSEGADTLQSNSATFCPRMCVAGVGELPGPDAGQVASGLANAMILRPATGKPSEFKSNTAGCLAKALPRVALRGAGSGWPVSGSMTNRRLTLLIALTWCTSDQTLPEPTRKECKPAGPRSFMFSKDVKPAGLAFPLRVTSTPPAQRSL